MIKEVELPFFSDIKYKLRSQKINSFENKAKFLVNFDDTPGTKEKFEEIWKIIYYGVTNDNFECDVFVHKLVFKYHSDIYIGKFDIEKYDSFRKLYDSFVRTIWLFFRNIHKIQTEEVLGNKITIIDDTTENKKRLIQSFFDLHTVTTNGIIRNEIKSKVSQKIIDNILFAENIIFGRKQTPFMSWVKNENWITEQKQLCLSFNSEKVIFYVQDNIYKKYFEIKKQMLEDIMNVFIHQVYDLSIYHHHNKKNDHEYFFRDNLFNDTQKIAEAYFYIFPEKVNLLNTKIEKNLKDIFKLIKDNYLEINKKGKNSTNSLEDLDNFEKMILNNIKNIDNS